MSRMLRSQSCGSFVIACFSLLCLLPRTRQQQTTLLGTWVAGSSQYDNVGTLGVLGVPSVNNMPRARSSAHTWYIPSTGEVWVFGGVGCRNYTSCPPWGELNDLWRYRMSDRTWTWMSGSSLSEMAGMYNTKGVGSPSSVPGGRYSGAAWLDEPNGELWLCCGYGFAASNTSKGYLNDVWSYKISTGIWTWWSGSNTINAGGNYDTLRSYTANNVPGSRQPAAYCFHNGNREFWMFSGVGIVTAGTGVAFVADVWKFNMTSKLWAWMDGTSQVNTRPVYGQPGARPGGREQSVCWLDETNGYMYIFAGHGWASTGVAGDLDDMWRYTLGASSNAWTFLSGSTATGSAGSYGPLGVASTSYRPGARSAPAFWFDSSTRELWIFGGAASIPPPLEYFSDFWRYSETSQTWAWMKGPSGGVASNGNYSTMGSPTLLGHPGSRYLALTWFESNSKRMWLYGGYAPFIPGWRNDIWTFSLYNNSDLGSIESAPAPVAQPKSPPVSNPPAGSSPVSSGPLSPPMSNSPTESVPFSSGQPQSPPIANPPTVSVPLSSEQPQSSPIYVPAIESSPTSAVQPPSVPAPSHATTNVIFAAVSDTGDTMQVTDRNGVITYSNTSIRWGFFGNSTFPHLIVPSVSGGAFLIGNNTFDSTEEEYIIQHVESSLNATTSPPIFLQGSQFPSNYISGFSYDAFMPQDESSQYIYMGTSYSRGPINRIAWRTGSLVQDGNWPMLRACADPDFSTSFYIFSGLAANTTHFFVSCHLSTETYSEGLILAVQRSDTTKRQVIHRSRDHLIGPLAMDDTHLYWAYWPGTRLGRYDYRAGQVLATWTELPSDLSNVAAYGAWRVRMYSEGGNPVLYVAMWTDSSSRVNCLRRVDPATGNQLSTLWATPSQCLSAMNDFYVSPSASVSFMHQPLPQPPRSPPATTADSVSGASPGLVGGIIGGIIAAIVLIAVIVAAIIIFRRRRAHQRNFDPSPTPTPPIPAPKPHMKSDKPSTKSADSSSSSSEEEEQGVVKLLPFN